VLTGTCTHTGVAARAVDASKVYGSGEATVRALDEITVAFDAHRYSAIMGPSGSGKSTLLHCLAGLDRVTSGQVFLGDVEVSAASEKQLTLIRRDSVGFIFQSYNLIPTLNALENMTLPMALAGRKPDRAWLDHVIDIVELRDRLTHRPNQLSGGQQQRVAVARALVSRPDVIFAGMTTDEARDKGVELLKRVSLGDRLSHKPFELSGGQQQRVAVARAMANDPTLILADEPTGNLDIKTGTEIIELLKKMNQEDGVTVISATHDHKMLSASDRIVWIRDGRVDRIEDRRDLRIEIGTIEGET
jgi:putative ABC transport system ATP-binding protein